MFRLLFRNILELKTGASVFGLPGDSRGQVDFAPAPVELQFALDAFRRQHSTLQRATARADDFHADREVRARSGHGKLCFADELVPWDFAAFGHRGSLIARG